MNILVSHPTGNRNVRAVLTSFFHNGVLAEFATTIAVDPKAFWLHLLPDTIRKDLLRRTYPIPEQKIWTHPSRELSRMILPKLGFKKILQHETGWASVDAVYQNLDLAVAKRLYHHKNRNNLTGVYAYEDGALATFEKANELRLTCIYDLPIAYWQTMRNLLMQEAERLPNWKNTLGGGILNSQEKLDRKTKELELADVIVTPGQFVAESIPDWARSKKIIVAPFGSPEARHQHEAETKNVYKRTDRPLRVLFAGSMGQRKGLGDLFAAVKKLNSCNIELVVMGSLLDSMSFYKAELPNFTYEPSRPHNEVLALMRSCDIFCLPSIVEGRALVMQEAMSQGLPLIITPNTGGSDLVIEGKTGFLVPISSPEAIAEKIEWFANNRKAAIMMGEAAKEHALQYTWEQYGETIVSALENFLISVN